MGAATEGAAVDATANAISSSTTTNSNTDNNSGPQAPPQTMHKSARGEAYYRDVLLQMQNEFARAVAALEKQISCLTEHNELLEDAQQEHQIDIAGLKQELEDVHEVRRQDQQRANDTIKSLQEELVMAQEDLRSEQLKMQTREQSLQHECSALKMLLQQEQDYWTRFEKAKQAELEKMSLQVAEAKAESMQSKDRNDSLCREIKLLQNRVDAAVRTSRNFEQRLKILSHQKHDEQMELEAEVLRLKRKVSEKREQNKYLSEALVAREEAATSVAASRRQQRPVSAPAVRSPSSISSTSSVFSDPVTESTFSSQYQPTHHNNNNNNNQKKKQRVEQVREEQVQPAVEKRLRKRDITLSVPSAKRAIPSSSAFETKLSHENHMHSHAPTSPTASSPDMTPPTSPRTRDNHTTNNGKTYTTSSSRQQPSSQRAVGGRSTRLDREMSDLRRKLDACMQFSLSP